jgi:hypothetical protein
VLRIVRRSPLRRRRPQPTMQSGQRSFATFLWTGPLPVVRRRRRPRRHSLHQHPPPACRQHPQSLATLQRSLAARRSLPLLQPRVRLLPSQESLRERIPASTSRRRPRQLARPPASRRKLRCSPHRRLSSTLTPRPRPTCSRIGRGCSRCSQQAAPRSGISVARVAEAMRSRALAPTVRRSSLARRPCLRRHPRLRRAPSPPRRPSIAHRFLR